MDNYVATSSQPLNKDYSKFLLILGNSGSGKSLFTKKLFYKLLAEFDENDSINHPFPLYFNLN